VTPNADAVAAVQSNDTLQNLIAQFNSFATGVLELDPEQAAIRAGLTFLVIVGAVIVLALLRLTIKAIASRVVPDENGKQRFRLGGWTIGIARIAVFFGALLVALQIWGVDLAAIMAGPMGGVIMTIGRIALTVVIMLVAIEIVQLAIARLFSRAAERARNARRGAQLRTIAPVISGVVTTAFFVIAAMMVLSDIGIEIGPLLAGAGIVGLAVGFGAQSLVKDFLTGIFLIIEDTVSIGDIAQIGDASGVVEDMSLRTIKLRAFDGTLQVIPYGEAQIIFNRTKGFSNAVFDLGISYSSNILKALELMKTVGDEMQADSELGPLIMQPIEVFGVDALGDSAVMLKGRLRTAPGQQWVVQREYLKRIKLAFDANGIDIPFPHLKLVAPDGAVPISETTTSKQTE
jgi:small conductance mechanosensitive channel